MSWIEKIRSKPHAEKLRLIWIICIIAAVILVILWIATSKIGKKLPKDTNLFQMIVRGVKNLR